MADINYPIANNDEFTQHKSQIKYGKEKTITGSLINLVDISGGKVINPPGGLHICGKNIFDKNSRVLGKIKNDSGVEINDTVSNYYGQFIPVKPGMMISMNFIPQRYYVFDANKNFLFRASTIFSSAITIPTNCYFIQIQVVVNQMSNEMQIEYGITSTDYEQYQSNNVGILYSPISNISNDAFTEMVVVYRNLTRTIESSVIGDYAVWQPDFTTNDYATSPIAPSLDISYVDFLATFYDAYIGKHQDGYVVNKKSLGNDSSNEGYELFEYDFIPKYYTSTVLLSAGMNATELSTIFGLAYFIKHVMEESDAGMAYIHENVRIKVIPIICPWSFDQSPIRYTNFNNVNINRNFNHLNSWESMTTGSGWDNKGLHPDSEAETKILKCWLSDNGNEANLWIDNHSMISSGGGNPDVLHFAISGGSEIIPLIRTAQTAITNYYIDKGYFNWGDTGEYSIGVGGLTVYPKHQYCKDIYNLSSIMIEQVVDSIWYGGDPLLNNDDGDIRNFIVMLRMYILAVLDKQVYRYTNNDDVYWFAYQSYKANRGRL